MTMRPSQIPDGKPIAARQPWSTFPVSYFINMIDLAAVSVRTLPDDQLATELDGLAQMCAGPDHHLAHRVLLRVYEADKARRNDPVRRFDAALDAALSQMVRNTNAPDRQIVRDIGQKLFDIGGLKAMRDAMQRSLAAVEPKKQAMRRHFIEKRWAGIGAAK